MSTIQTLVSDHMQYREEVIDKYARPITISMSTFICPICGTQRADSPPHGQTTACVCGSEFYVSGNRLSITVPARLASPQPSPDETGQAPAAVAYVSPFGTVHEMEWAIIVLLLMLILAALTIAFGGAW